MTRLASRKELEALRKKITTTRDPERKAVAVCAGRAVEGET